MPHSFAASMATVFLLSINLDCVMAQEAINGEFVFRHRCLYCHETATEKIKIGPSLKGIFGRKSGSVADFKYSDAMKTANVIWDEASLKAYLANPKAFIPQNLMAFNGLRREIEMEVLIPYLKEATK